MRQLIILISMMCFLCLNISQAQDLHFAQYSSAPTTLNPALTGFMDGNFRANVNYRNQWFKGSSFSTYALSTDVNIARRQLDYDMLGVGLSFYYDVEERSGYSNMNITLTGAYNVMLTDRPLQYIGFGIQPSLLRKQINLMDAVYGTLYETGVNTDPIDFDIFGNMKFDLNMGLSYYGFYKEKHVFSAGITISHITQPDFGLNGNDYLFRKYTGYILTELEAGRTGLAWLKPSIYFTKQGPSIEVLPALFSRFQFYNAVNDVYLGFGVGARMVGHQEKNAISTDFIAQVQLIIEEYTIGFSYDLAFSDIKTITTRNGGPELSLIIDLNFDRRIHPRYFKMMKL